MMPPEQIDQKFAQAGWSLDPHICPDCRRAAAKEIFDMATKPTPAAIKAQAKMFTLLTQHFDVDAGAYGAGWSDQKIAVESGLAPETVAEFRREAFGEIKEPQEVRQLRGDINAVKGLIDEAVVSLNAEIASLLSRLAEISKQWAA